VNIVIPNSSKSVVAEAIKLAQEITANSPDAVQAAKHGLVLAQNLQHKEAVLAHVWSRLCERLYEGRNIKEGLEAFAAVCAHLFISTTRNFSFLFFFFSFLFLIPVADGVIFFFYGSFVCGRNALLCGRIQLNFEVRKGRHFMYVTYIHTYLPSIFCCSIEMGRIRNC